jgi:hypothetical protein
MYLDPLVRRRRLLLQDVCIYPNVIKAVVSSIRFMSLNMDDEIERRVNHDNSWIYCRSVRLPNHAVLRRNNRRLARSNSLEHYATTGLQLQVHCRIYGVFGWMPVCGGGLHTRMFSRIWSMSRRLRQQWGRWRRWRPRAKSALRLPRGNRVPRRMRQGARRRPYLQRGLC